MPLDGHGILFIRAVHHCVGILCPVDTEDSRRVVFLYQIEHLHCRRGVLLCGWNSICFSHVMTGKCFGLVELELLLARTVRTVV